MPPVVAVPAAESHAASLSLGGLLVLAFGALDFGLESSIVLAGAAGRSPQEYGASLDHRLVAGDRFLLASVVAVPLFGRLGDIFGRRRLLLVALGAFASDR